MTENALLASIREGISNAGIVAPSDTSAILHIVFEQVTRPENISTRPSLQSGAAKSVDEDKISSAGVPVTIVERLQRPNPFRHCHFSSAPVFWQYEMLLDITRKRRTSDRSLT